MSTLKTPPASTPSRPLPPPLPADIAEDVWATSKAVAARIPHMPYWIERADLQQSAAVAYIKGYREWAAAGRSDADWHKMKFVSVFRDLINELKSEISRHAQPWGSLDFDPLDPRTELQPIDRAALNEALASLPDRHRELLCDAYMCDMTQVEVARFHGISPAAVGKALGKIINRIKGSHES